MTWRAHRHVVALRVRSRYLARTFVLRVIRSSVTSTATDAVMADDKAWPSSGDDWAALTRCATQKRCRPTSTAPASAPDIAAPRASIPGPVSRPRTRPDIARPAQHATAATAVRSARRSIESRQIPGIMLSLRSLCSSRLSGMMPIARTSTAYAMAKRATTADTRITGPAAEP